MAQTNRIHLVTAADHRFMRPLAALLKSIERSNPDDDLSVSVLTGPAEAASGGPLDSGLDVRWVGVPEDMTLGIEMPSFLENSSLWRLFLAELLPPALERVIFLDADMIVRRPLRPLWNVDFEGGTVAAVRDPLVPWFGAPNGPPWEELGVAPDRPYFNAGAMLVDLSAWRDGEVGQRCLMILRDRALPYGDQCALNAVLADSWRPLPPCWNVQAGHLWGRGGFAPIIESGAELNEAISNPSIVHFNTSPFGRPWLHGCTHPYRDEWFAALDETEFAGWRPHPDPMAPRVARRLRLATATLLRGRQ
jgi:lipopolysaccharide biosynthesis glycosyltransferase